MLHVSCSGRCVFCLGCFLQVFFPPGFFLVRAHLFFYFFSYFFFHGCEYLSEQIDPSLRNGWVKLQTMEGSATYKIAAGRDLSDLDPGEVLFN